MDEYSSADWEESLTHSYDEITLQFMDFAPQLMAAIALLILG